MPPGKRKAKGREAGPRRKPGRGLDEEIDSDIEDDILETAPAQAKKKGKSAGAAAGAGDESDVDGDRDPFILEETADEKRVRLAKQILSKYRSEEEADATAEIDTNEAIAARLQKAVLESSGKFQRKIAAKLIDREWASAPQRVMRGHELSVTSVTLTEDDRTAFTGSKDCTVIRHDVETGKRVYFPGKRGDSSAGGHTDHVLCVCVSSDGRLLASGGADRMVRVWDLATNKGVAFRAGSHDLYSCGYDRLVKVWNCDDMAYVESLFGHVDHITSIDSLSRERALTSGRDHCLRLYKTLEDTHLVFRGAPTTSMDCARMVNEEVFVSGDDAGTVYLWSVNRKKAMDTVEAAHGPGRWICSVGAWRYADVVASGSSDGAVRLWQCADDNTRLRPLHQFAQTGFVNGLVFAKSGRFLLAAVGQEHRLGRWERIPAARNGLVMFSLPVQPGDLK